MNWIIIDYNEPLIDLFIARYKEQSVIKLVSTGKGIDGILRRLEQFTSLRAVFINAHLKYTEGDKLQNNQGIELVKHIRLTNSLKEDIRKCPIVLYSFLLPEWFVKKNPKNFFLFSPGVVVINSTELFHTMTNGREIIVGKGGKKVKPLDSLLSLKEYFKLDTSEALNFEKHRIANWWGPLRLLIGYKIFRSGGTYTTDLKNLTRDVGKLYDHLSTAKLTDKELLFLNFVATPIFNERKGKLISDFVSEIETYRYAFSKDFTKLSYIPSKQEDADNLPVIIDQICSKKEIKGILYIDDDADNGWLDVMNLMLGANIITCIKTITDAMRFVHYSSLRNFVFVLLDLRISDEESTSSEDIENLSGVKLLRMIKDPKKGDPSIPVIMFTASSRADILERLTSLGADGFWSKEGLAKLPDDNYSLLNYLKLRKQVIWALTTLSLRDVWRNVVSLQRKQVDEYTMGFLYKAFSFLRIHKNVWMTLSLSTGEPYAESVMNSYLAVEHRIINLLDRCSISDPNEFLRQNGFKSAIDQLLKVKVISKDLRASMWMLSETRNDATHIRSDSVTYDSALKCLNRAIDIVSKTIQIAAPRKK